MGDCCETSNVYTQWCEPIVAALWERNEKKIQAKLAEARKALTSGTLFENEVETLESHLTYFEFQASTISGEKGKLKLRKMFPTWLAKLETVSKFEQVSQLRASLLLQLSIFLDRMGLRTLDQKRFNAIETKVGETKFSSETWYYIAVWAYKYEYTDVLEKAFIHFLDRVRANEFYNEWSYHLTKLMFNIHSNCATKTELQHIIALAKDPTQLKVIKCVIWEAASNLSLIDTEVCIAFDVRMEKLVSNVDSYRSVGQFDQANTPPVSRQVAN